MPPYLPIISLDRSQQTRVGRGPRNTVPVPMIPNKQGTLLRNAFYADMGQGEVRRDLQRHSGVSGAVMDVGNTSLTVTSDFFKVSGFTTAVATGTGFTVSTAAGILQSRTFGDTLSVAATSNSLLPAAPPVAGGRTDYVVVDNTGTVSIIQGNSDALAPTYQVLTFAVASGTPTAGNFQLYYTYNGFSFKTGNIAWNAAGSAIVTAILAATAPGGPNGVSLTNLLGSGTFLTGAGANVSAGAATATASNQLEGRIVPVAIDNSGVTGGTYGVTETTVGVGVTTPWPAGNVMVLGSIYVPSTASSSSNYIITNASLPTT